MKFNVFNRRERRRDRSGLPVNAIKKQLDHLSREGKFKVAILATENSLISVNIDSELDSSQISTIARSIWKISKIANEFEEVLDIHQISLSEMSGENGIICYSFTVRKQMVVLICITKVESVHSELIEKASKGIVRIITE